MHLPLPENKQCKLDFFKLSVQTEQYGIEK